MLKTMSKLRYQVRDASNRCEIQSRTESEARAYVALFPQRQFEIVRVVARPDGSGYRTRVCDAEAQGNDDVAQQEQIRHGSFGPIVWDTITGDTRVATQHDMDTLPVGPDLTDEEEAGIEEH